jgi:hypothetical protein
VILDRKRHRAFEARGGQDVAAVTSRREPLNDQPQALRHPGGRVTITWLSSTGKDKSVTMFQSYVAAYLSIKIGNDGSCVSQTMTDAYNWLVSYPVGSGVAGGSAAWALGQPIQSTLDAYDNGLLCAPHRN